MIEREYLKRELIELALNIARPVFFRVENEKKELITVGMVSNLYVSTFKGFLIEPKDLEVDLTPILEYWDKANLVKVITHPNLDEVNEWVKDIATPETRLAGSFIIPTTGLKVPFLTKKHPYEIQDEEEALELFIPIFNEWSFEENCYANFTTFKMGNAKLKVDKITSQEDVDKLVQVEKARYEEYKEKYPKDMALVEELYDEYKEKWIREVESLK